MITTVIKWAHNLCIPRRNTVHNDNSNGYCIIKKLFENNYYVVMDMETILRHNGCRECVEQQQNMNDIW